MNCCFLYHLLPYSKIFGLNTVPTYYHKELSLCFPSWYGSLEQIMYEGFYILITFFIISWPKSFYVLKSFTTSTFRFCWCIVTEVYFSRSPVNKKLLYPALTFLHESHLYGCLVLAVKHLYLRTIVKLRCKYNVRNITGSVINVMSWLLLGNRNLY